MASVALSIECWSRDPEIRGSIPRQKPWATGPIFRTVTAPSILYYTGIFPTLKFTIPPISMLLAIEFKGNLSAILHIYKLQITVLAMFMHCMKYSI